MKGVAGITAVSREGEYVRLGKGEVRKVEVPRNGLHGGDATRTHKPVVAFGAGATHLEWLLQYIRKAYLLMPRAERAEIWGLGNYKKASGEV